jgi:tetratricopeptide (TPR) repeat protein
MGKFQETTWWRQARQDYQAGRLQQARAACERLLQRDAANVDALSLLGQIAYDLGFLEQAAGHMARCAALRPRDPRPHLALGEIRNLQGRHDEAVDQFERALRLQPQDPRAVTGKADAFERWGQRDRARAVLQPYVAGGRETGEMAVVQARLDLRARRHDAVVDLARRHLERPEAADTTRWHLGFLLGRALERAGRFDESFAAYRQANQVLAASFDAGAWRQYTDRLVEAFSPQRFAALPRATHGSGLPVFIVGMPRSGSTLVEGELEATHFLIESIPLEIGSDLPYPACVEDLDREDADGLSRTYLDRLSALAPRARRIADKYLINYRHLGLLAAFFPEGRIVHCRRHPLDIGISCFATALMPRVHPWSCDLGHIGAVYLDYERLMGHWRDRLEIPMLEVAYEALVADPEPWTRRIIEFCGLDWDDGCLRFHEGGRVVPTASYDQVTRPVYTTSVGRYRGFEPHLGPLTDALAAGG